MAAPPVENPSDWAFDYELLADLPPLEHCFQWPGPQNALPPPSSVSVELEDSFGNPGRTTNSRKRLRSGVCGTSHSKAHKEKMRRDKLNDRFQELSSLLEPGRPPKIDKTIVLSDAVRMVNQLRDEAQKLKELHGSLQGKVIELKTEKNELRDEKMMLKAEKERLEQQVKELSARPGILPHLPPIHSPFVAPQQVIGGKLVPFIGFSGVPMWQLMPHIAVDTSEDHTLRPPVA